MLASNSVMTTSTTQSKLSRFFSNNDDSTDDSNTTMMNCRDNQKSCKSTNGSKPTQYHAQGTFPSSPETLLC